MSCTFFNFPHPWVQLHPWHIVIPSLFSMTRESSWFNGRERSSSHGPPGLGTFVGRAGRRGGESHTKSLGDRRARAVDGQMGKVCVITYHQEVSGNLLNHWLHVQSKFGESWLVSPSPAIALTWCWDQVPRTSPPERLGHLNVPTETHFRAWYNWPMGWRCQFWIRSHIMDKERTLRFDLRKDGNSWSRMMFLRTSASMTLIWSNLSWKMHLSELQNSKIQWCIIISSMEWPSFGVHPIFRANLHDSFVTSLVFTLKSNRVLYIYIYWILFNNIFIFYSIVSLHNIFP